MAERTTVIIPAGGVGPKMLKAGNRFLLDLGNGQTVQSRLLEQIHLSFPNADLLILAGPQDHIPGQTTLPYYADTTELELLFELRDQLGDQLLFVPGNSVYSADVFPSLLDSNNPGSALLAEAFTRERRLEAGMVIEGDYVDHMAFGLPVKWAGVALLVGEELSLFLEGLDEACERGFLVWELFEWVIAQGGRFRACVPRPLPYQPIHSMTDWRLARVFVEENK